MEMEIGYEKGLKVQLKKERAAVKLQNKVGELLYDKGIELVLFRNHLTDITISEILNLHEYSKKVVSQPIDVFTTSELAACLLEMDLIPAKMDIGKLANEWIIEQGEYSSKKDFLSSKLSLLKPEHGDIEPRDVVLYGFGRIGRLAARELIKHLNDWR